MSDEEEGERSFVVGRDYESDTSLFSCKCASFEGLIPQRRMGTCVQLFRRGDGWFLRAGQGFCEDLMVGALSRRARVWWIWMGFGKHDENAL